MKIKTACFALLGILLFCGFRQAPAKQRWQLMDDTGQTAFVEIAPFSLTGTFNETDDSPGWYITCGQGSMIRIPLYGTIVHDGNNDRWSFTISVGGCGCTAQGQGAGMTIGQYPDANLIAGSYLLTSSTCAMTSAPHQWRGVRVK